MNLFEKIINILATTGETPASFGLFHFIFVIILIISCYFLCKYFKNCSMKTVNKILLYSWITMLVLEIYKQIVFSFNYNDGNPIWDYQWYAFPYQLCSTPLYVIPLILIIKHAKIKSALIAFMSTFSLFGGLAVMVFPNDVFTSIIGINFQTMIHHSLQVLLGIFLLVHNRNNLNKKYYYKSCIVFIITLVIAIILNEVVYSYFQNNNISESFNMFFISRHFDCTLPLLNMIYPNVHFVTFTFIYLFGFILISLIILLVTKGIYNLVIKKENNIGCTDE